MRPFHLAAAMVLLAVPAHAQDIVPSGQLSCRVEGGLGAVVTAQRNLDCQYSPRRGPVQRYVGTVRGFGLDIGPLRRTTMRWRVYGPYARAPRGALTGSYVGAAASVALGGGVAGQVLVGGPDNGVRLQPFSLQGPRGFNVAVGVTRFDLAARGARPR